MLRCSDQHPERTSLLIGAVPISQSPLRTDDRLGVAVVGSEGSEPAASAHKRSQNERPEDLTIYRSIIREDPSKFRWSTFFVVISLVYVALGGFVAMLLQPSSYYSAFYTGLAFPFIVNSLSERAQNMLTPQVKGASAVLIR